MGFAETASRLQSPWNEFPGLNSVHFDAFALGRKIYLCAGDAERVLGISRVVVGWGEDNDGELEIVKMFEDGASASCSSCGFQGVEWSAVARSRVVVFRFAFAQQALQLESVFLNG